MVAIYRVSGSLATFSIIGSLLILSTAFFLKSLRTHPTSLVLLLAFSDLMFSLKFAITSVIPDSQSLMQNHYWCLLQAGFGQFFGIASVSWNAMITINLFFSIRKPFSDTRAYVKFYHAYVWTIAVTTTFFILITGNYGISGDGTCWLKGQSYSAWVFYGPLFVYQILGIATVIFTCLRIKNIANKSIYQRKIITRMLAYVAVFILCWAGPIAHKIYQYQEGDKVENSVLDYMDTIGVSIQGFMNACVWLTNPTFFKALKKYILIPYCPCILTSSERIPLIPGQAEFEDDEQDLHKMNTSLRRNMLLTVLLSIRQSVNSIKEEDIMESSFSQTTELTKVAHSTISNLNIEDIDSILNFNFFFQDYAPQIFREIRKLNGLNESDYLKTLDPESVLKTALQNQKFSDGRSGSFFVFSEDKSLIIKTIPEQEAKVLQSIIMQYYEYLKSHPESLIVRFYGCYQLNMLNGEPLFITVMASAFSNPQLKMSEVYDLKGSWIDRGGKKEVKSMGKDMDFIKANRKLKVNSDQKKKLLESLRKDSEFLRDLNIMDYSLLVGIYFSANPRVSLTEEVNENFVTMEERMLEEGFAQTDSLSTIVATDKSAIYFIGIIDILQAWNFQKKLERFFKVYFRCKNANGISCVNPNKYSSRFLERVEGILVTNSEFE